MGYTYLIIGSFQCVWPTGGCHTLEPYYHIFGTSSQISGNVSEIQDLFMSLGLAVLRKNLTGDYRQVFAREGLVLCVW